MDYLVFQLQAREENFLLLYKILKKINLSNVLRTITKWKTDNIEGIFGAGFNFSILHALQIMYSYFKPDKKKYILICINQVGQSGPNLIPGPNNIQNQTSALLCPTPPSEPANQ